VNLGRFRVLRERLHRVVYALMFDMGGLADDELFTTVELVGTEVIPAIDSSRVRIGTRT
jgi:hypothetical protein